MSATFGALPSSGRCTTLFLAAALLAAVGRCDGFQLCRTADVGALARDDAGLGTRARAPSPRVCLRPGYAMTLSFSWEQAPSSVPRIVQVDDVRKEVCGVKRGCLYFLGLQLTVLCLVRVKSTWSVKSLHARAKRRRMASACASQPKTRSPR